MIKSDFFDKLHELKKELDSIDKQLLIDFPEVNYYEKIKSLRLTCTYKFVPQNLRDDVDRIRLRYGQEAVPIYHKLVLCFFIIRSSIYLQNNKDFPESILSFYSRYFEWILKHIFDSKVDDIHYYDHDNDLFLKDLNLCSLRMFPIGSQVVELSTAPRRFVISGGLSQFFGAASFYLTTLYRKLPFYQVHLDTRWVSDFNRTGWYTFYSLIADMLKRNPDVKGVFGASWFYDPYLEKISPGLLYLRKVPEQGGARLFKVGSSYSDIENATYKSERRRRLYEEGKYTPTNYVFVWLRDDLIRWAENPSGFLSAYNLPK